MSRVRGGMSSSHKEILGEIASFGKYLKKKLRMKNLKESWRWFSFELVGFRIDWADSYHRLRREIPEGF